MWGLATRLTAKFTTALIISTKPRRLFGGDQHSLRTIIDRHRET